MEDFERWEMGRHLSLIQRRHLLYISNIPRYVVPSFSTAYDICDEFKDLAWTKEVREWLDYNLQLAVSVGARGRDDLVKALAGDIDAHMHPDEGQEAPSARRAPSDLNGAIRGAKAPLKEAGRFGLG